MAPRKQAVAFQARSVQVSDYIRMLIQTGQWEDQLPSEREMAKKIGVSRETIRDAITLLQQDGIIGERSRRKGTSIRMARPATSGTSTVGILVLMKMEHATYRTLAWIDELRRHLYQKGISVDIYDGYMRQRGFFKTLAARAHHDCWVLVYPNQRALKWCIDSKVRAVVVGTIPETLEIPSVDIHYRALCQHAVGRMIQMGHRHLALILDKREWGGDTESIAGFKEGAATSNRSEITASVYYHRGQPGNLCDLADRLLAMSPRPTAWMIAVAPHFLTVLMHLQRRGISVPDEISLISQDAEPWQHFATPEPTRYVADVPLLARATAREVFRTLSGKPRIIKPHRIFPELKQGKTLASPKA